MEEFIVVRGARTHNLKNLTLKNPELHEESLQEMIALGAIKYWILRQSIGKDIIFDKEKALSLDGDSA